MHSPTNESERPQHSDFSEAPNTLFGGARAWGAGLCGHGVLAYAGMGCWPVRAWGTGLCGHGVLACAGMGCWPVRAWGAGLCGHGVLACVGPGALRCPAACGTRRGPRPATAHTKPTCGLHTNVAVCGVCAPACYLVRAAVPCCALPTLATAVHSCLAAWHKSSRLGDRGQQ